MNDAVLEAVERLRPVAEGAGLTLAEMALAWVLRRPEVASAIVGASRPEQVHANAAASGIELSDDVLEAIDRGARGRAVKEPMLAPFARAGVMPAAEPRPVSRRGTSLMPEITPTVKSPRKAGLSVCSGGSQSGRLEGPDQHRPSTDVPW